MARYKNSGSFTFQPFTNWNDPLSCGDKIRKDDLIILVLAHVGYISYIPFMDSLTSRLENRFPNYSRIVVYPKQQKVEHLLGNEDLIFIP